MDCCHGVPARLWRNRNTPRPGQRPYAPGPLQSAATVAAVQKAARISLRSVRRRSLLAADGDVVVSATRQRHVLTHFMPHARAQLQRNEGVHRARRHGAMKIVGTLVGLDLPIASGGGAARHLLIRARCFRFFLLRWTCPQGTCGRRLRNQLHRHRAPTPRSRENLRPLSVAVTGGSYSPQGGRGPGAGAQLDLGGPQLLHDFVSARDGMHAAGIRCEP